MKGKVRVPRRHLKCPKCGNLFEDIGKKGYVCPDCLTVPDRYYLDLHYRGKRVRIFCDKQGIPLDSFERAFDLLAHINYEINDRSFDPSKYVKSEQKEFYVCTQIDRYEAYKIDSLAPSYKTDFKRYIGIARVFWGSRDIREIRKIDIINYQDYLQKNSASAINRLKILWMFSRLS